MNNLLKQQYIRLIECNNEEISILANTKLHHQEKLFLLKMFINLKDILPVTVKVIVKSLSH